MNTILWIAQILLAVGFLMSGVMKATQPKEKLAEKMKWVQDFSEGQIRLIGILEILGAVGVVLPALTGILPWLTPIAATGLVLTMIGAALTHLRRGEYPNIIANMVLLTLAVVVVFGRFFVTPIIYQPPFGNVKGSLIE
jgi:uncharacterized membrane protein YphA (DoxX/SURF4 family)